MTAPDQAGAPAPKAKSFAALRHPGCRIYLVGTMLAMMAERGIPVVLGSDSHTPERVGWDFDVALDQLEAAGYKNVSYFTLRQRQELAISDVRAALVDAPLPW